MKSKITALLLLSFINITAQTTFRKGVIKKINGKEEKVFIKVYGSKIPNDINYKHNLETDIIKTIKVSSLQYLEVLDKEKYIRKDVQLEVLDKGMSAKLSNNSPKFNKINKSVFLKVLLESNSIKLLSYLDKENKNKYFFVENKNVVELLSYKEIKINNKKEKIKNYRKELYKKYKIQGKFNYAKLKYGEIFFINYFKKYLTQVGEEFNLSNTFSRTFKDAVNLNLALGNGFLSQKINNESTNFNSTSTINTFNFGLQVEYFFNENVKNYSLIFDAKYYINGKKENSFDFKTNTSSFESTIENNFSMTTVDFMIRKYWNINRNSNIFTNVGIGKYNISDKVNYIQNSNNEIFVDLESNNKENTYFSFGIGYNYKSFIVNLDYFLLNGGFNSLVTSSTTFDFSYDRKLLNFSLSYILF